MLQDLGSLLGYLGGSNAVTRVLPKRKARTVREGCMTWKQSQTDAGRGAKDPGVRLEARKCKDWILH